MQTLPVPATPSATPFALRTLTRIVVISLGLACAGLACANTVEEASQSLKAGQHAKALEQIDRYLNNKPKDPQGRFLKGIILTGMNRTNEAIKIFQKLTEDYPDLPEPYNNLAVIYAQQNQYERAKEALEKAIRTHPAYATAHENLGDIYTRLASQAYGKALQIDSSNASAQTKLAMINDLVGTTKGGKTPSAPAATIVASAEPVKPTPKSEPPKPVEPPPVQPPAKPEAVKVEPPKVDLPKTEAPKPAPKPVADLDSEITAAVDGWIGAWSKKDVKAYLGFYAKEFQPPGGVSRKEWEAERTQRVGKPGKIEVSRDKLAIKLEDDKAVVRFRQHYKSANLNTSSGKTLVLVKRDGKWLIQQERVGG